MSVTLAYVGGDMAVVQWQSAPGAAATSLRERPWKNPFEVVKRQASLGLEIV